MEIWKCNWLPNSNFFLKKCGKTQVKIQDLKSFALIRSMNSFLAIHLYEYDSKGFYLPQKEISFTYNFVNSSINQ